MRTQLTKTRAMALKRSSDPTKRPAPRRIFEERGDASTKVLHQTIVVCAVALVAVLAFSFSPRKKAVPTPASLARAEAQGQAPVASFDRASLSTKNR